METKHVILFAVALGASACQPSVSSEVSTTAAQINPVSTAKAADAVGAAHCRHVYQCNEFGGAHRFRDYDSCARAVRSETLESLSCTEIPAAKLSSCLEAIRASECGAPRSARFSSCSDERLCR